MADRVVASTDTLNYFRHEFNGTAADVGDIADILSASSYIASATDVVESIVLLNPDFLKLRQMLLCFQHQLWFGKAQQMMIMN